MAEGTPRTRALDELLKDNKHLAGHEKKRNLGNISPDDIAPAVISQIAKAVCEPLIYPKIV